MGKTTKQAMQNLRNGMPWSESGVVGAEGNGTAMRAAPFGAFYQEDPLTAAQFARMEANITHKSLEAEEGSAAVAVAVSLLWTGARPREVVEKTIEYLRDSKVKLALSRLVFYQKSYDVSAVEALKLFGTRHTLFKPCPQPSQPLSSLLLTKMPSLHPLGREETQIQQPPLPERSPELTMGSNQSPSHTEKDSRIGNI